MQIAALGMINTRLKDYYDLYSLAQTCDATPAAIASAIQATFRRRNTVVPGDWPVGLTSQFADDVGKRRHWNSFLEKNRVAGPTLMHAIEVIQRLLCEPLELARAARPRCSQAQGT